MMENKSQLSAQREPDSDPNCNDNISEGSSLNPVEDNDLKCKNIPNQFASSSFMQESSEFQWCMDDACTREYDDDEVHPTSIFALNDVNSSYDDISKNFDVNLAEIDMETFCSEDINSILSLPPMYGESATSLTDNTQNTSESCSSNGKMETNSHSLSDGVSETSLYKNKPLFSPVKEHEVRIGTISTDSLDFSSLGKQTLNGQALKKNYTIVFEASMTQLSDDTHGCDVKAADKSSRVSMAQSDILWNPSTKSKQKFPLDRCVAKARSFPSLLEQRFHMSNANVNYDKEIPFYDAQNNQVHSLKHSKLSLLSTNRQNQLFFNNHLQRETESRVFKDQSSMTCSGKFILQFDGEKNHSDQLITEKNSDNNNVATCSGNDNLDVSGLTTENENSLCFEDSLMEVTPPKNRFAYSSPIKEEPSETSSGEDTMMYSKDSSRFYQCSIGMNKENDSSNEFLQPNTKNCGVQQDLSHVTVSVSTNESIFQTNYLKSSHFGKADSVIVKESASQSTQTKFINPAANSAMGRIMNESSLPSLNEMSALQLPTRSGGISNILRTQDNCTQIPVHIKDKGVQTSFCGNVEWKIFEHDPESSGFVTRKISSSASSGSVYIYYPNYSLPDLSFLNPAINADSGFILTSPNTSSAVNKECRRRARSSEGRGRPRSFASEQHRPINNVADWSSLSILLPENIKGIFRDRENQSSDRRSTSTDSNSLSHVNKPILFPKRSASLGLKSSGPKFRPLDASRQNDRDTSIFKTNSKRWSLQEPIAKYDFSEKVSHKSSSIQHSLRHNNQQAPESAQDLKAYIACSHGAKSSNDFLCRPSKVNGSHTTDFPIIEKIDNTACTHQSPLDWGAKGIRSYSESPCNSGFYDRNEWNSPPPLEFKVSPSSSPKAVTEISSPEEALWVALVNKKAYMLQGMKDSVKCIVSVFKAKDKQLKEGSSCDFQILCFCQCLYEIISDGLQVSEDPRLLTSDLTWKVIRATVFFDTDNVSCFQTLFQEVCDEQFEESLLKFYSFVVGLINMGWMERWFIYFLSCHQIIDRYYTSSALPHLLVSEFSSGLQDQLSEILKQLIDVACGIELFSVLRCLFKDGNLYKSSKFDGQFTLSDDQTMPVRSLKASGSESEFYLALKNNECQTVQAKAHVQSVLRKTKSLKEVAEYENLLPGATTMVVYSSDKTRQIQRVQLHRFQQLKQRWEKLSALEDSASCTKESTSYKSPDANQSERKSLKEKNCTKATKTSDGKCLLGKAHSEALEFENTPAPTKKRSLIPTPKGMKALGNRRSGSAPSEKRNR